jgi:hypothetical protein
MFNASVTKKIWKYITRSRNFRRLFFFHGNFRLKDRSLNSKVSDYTSAEKTVQRDLKYKTHQMSAIWENSIVSYSQIKFVETAFLRQTKSQTLDCFSSLITSAVSNFSIQKIKFGTSLFFLVIFVVEFSVFCTHLQ